MQIAIVGAGVAGLGLLWHLLKNPSVSVTLFDPKGIGGGASGASTGLLYPFPGKCALRSWSSEEGMGATRELLSAAEKALGRPVAAYTGVLRPAMNEQQLKDFQSCQAKEPATAWIEDVRTLVPEAANASGFWIPEGMTVYSKPYLEGLWLACEQKGAKQALQSISDLEELKGFDRIVLATGAETLRFKECQDLPLKLTKGQALICRLTEPPPMSLISQGHLSLTEEPGFCAIGSTYESRYLDSSPDPEKALKLLEKIAIFYPPAKNFEVMEIRSGIRISPREGYRPICRQLNAKTWVFTGLGSRGMLYHALYGQMLAKELVL